MDQIQTMRKILSRGEEVRFKVSGKITVSHVSIGDSVLIRHVPVRDVEPGDVVLCEINDQACLREVTKVRTIKGVRCLEVIVPEGFGVSQFINDTAYLGKVMGPEDPLELPPIVRSLLRLFGVRRSGVFV